MLFWMPILAVVVALLVWGYFNPLAANGAYLSLAGGLLAYLIVSSNMSKRRDVVVPESEPYNLDHFEADMVMKFPLYFWHPVSSIALSLGLQFVHLSGFVWAAWMLYQHAWFNAVLSLGLAFIAGNQSARLNPLLYFEAEIKKGKDKSMDLVIGQSALRKLWSSGQAS